MLGKTNITTLSEGAIVTEVEDFKWIQVQSGIYGNFIKAIYKNDYLVAITADGTVVYTTDGEVWQTSVLEYEDCKLNDIEWDGSRFILVGSHTATVGNVTATYGLILITTDLVNFTLFDIKSEDDDTTHHNEEYYAVYTKNGKYYILANRLDYASYDLCLYESDLVNTIGKSIYVWTYYFGKGTISVAKNSNEMLLCFNASTYNVNNDNYNYVRKINGDNIAAVKMLSKKNTDTPMVFAVECKDTLYYMSTLTQDNYEFAKVSEANETFAMSTEKNFAFRSGVYFNNCELFINNHEMLIVKKGESIADKTLDDLIEIAPELTMNCITKAFGQLYIFGNQGAILKSSVETNNESVITVQTLSAKKALSDAKKYADTKIADSSCFQPGDVVNLSPNLPFAGYITGGKTQIICTIPLNRITEGRTVNLEGALTVRGMQEYVLNRVELSDYNISITPTHNFLRLIIENKDKSAFGGNNNCPLAISFEYGLKITFS